MVFGLFLLLGILSLILAAAYKSKVGMIASGVFLLLSIIIPIGIYSSNIGVIADLEAFYRTSNQNFGIARDDTASYLSEEKIQAEPTLIPIYGSIEKIGMGQSVAARIQEYRDAVNDYNSSIARYKAYKDNALYGVAYPNYPSDIRLLIISRSEK